MNNSKNWCPQFKIREYELPCLDCSSKNLNCQRSDTKVDDSIKNCTYHIEILDITFTVPGCTFTCKTMDVNHECCTGFWGEDCRACPGGADQPCGGHGVCSDSINGTGVCQCKEGIAGYACELCEEADAYGPDCSLRCQCQHGNCTGNGIYGTGTCECFSGYEGIYCDQEIVSCKTTQCQANARCVEDAEEGPVCHCMHGFTANGSLCQEVNMCEGPTNCHENATCLHIGPQAYSCTCLDGFQGDGFYCDPIDPCQENFGGCDLETSDCVYLAPNSSKCVCLEGYILHPQYEMCVIEDLCPSQGHSCDENANCSTIIPGFISCECREGYIGDGFVCYGNILERLYDLNINDRKLRAQLSSSIQLVEFAFKETLSTGGPFTIFIPTDSAFGLVGRNQWYLDLFLKAHFARNFLLHHIIAHPLRAEELNNQTTFYTLEGDTAKMKYMSDSLIYQLSGDFKTAAVLEKDIIASNGVIHVINQVLYRGRHTEAVKSSIWDTLNSMWQFRNVNTLLNKMKDQGFQLPDMTGSQWTFLVPQIKAFGSLLEGTMDHLQNPQQRDKLDLLIRNHVVKGRMINITDLVKMKKIVTMANNGIKVSVTDVGQVMLGDNTSILASQIEVTNGVIHAIDNLLIPDSIETLLPRFCPVKHTVEVKGPCESCYLNSCDRSTDIPTGKNEVCFFNVNLQFDNDYFGPFPFRHGYSFVPFHRKIVKRSIFPRFIRKKGCRKVCKRVENEKKECCDNFYGKDCYPCLGGHENPCFGRGTCLDSMTGNGTCICDPQFTGTGCETCVDENKYGPYCNQTCKCMHGVCYNHVTGLGTCKHPCKAGYTGIYCQLTKQKCSRYLRCHVHAECIKPRGQSMNFRGRRRNKSYCQCKPGYTGPGSHCEEIDPCETGALECHVDATCKKTGPGLGECSCNEGWVGDGLYCFPSTTCKTEEHCHANAGCVTVRPGLSHCECNENYHGNGTFCLPVDVCEDNFIGCDKHATCNSTGPGEGTCTCDVNLAGNGYTCYGGIAFELQHEDELKEIYKLTTIIQPNDRYLSDLRANFTFFAPNSTAVVELLEQEDSAWTSIERNLLLLLRYHTLSVTLSVENLHAMNAIQLQPLVENFYLNVTVFGTDVYINDAKIIKADIPALNGLIHIVDKILEPYPPPELLPSLGRMLQQTPQFSLFYYLMKKYSWLKPNGLLNDEISQEMYEYTVFVPVNSAWEGMEWSNVTSSRYLKSLFLINRRLTKSDLMEFDGQRLPTLLGSGTEQSAIVNTRDNNTLLINGIEVVLPDLKTYAGYVHGMKNLPQTVLNFCEEDNEPNKCCLGYYGDLCKECPGGASNPCSGRGKCQSNGVCHCQSPYSGEACDLCENHLCKSVDHCSINNGGCHPFADCILADKLVTCQCVEGYIGNGYHCVSPCQIEKGVCHENASCELEYKKASCRCQQGFTGNGKQCSPVLGPCDYSNGGCSVYAECSYKQVDKPAVLCTCKEGYTGDGFTCLTNAWQTLKDMVHEDPTMKPFLQMLRKPENLEVKRIMTNEEQNVTVFVPESKDLSNMTGASFVSKSLIILDNSQRSDLVVRCLDLSSLYITVDYNASETDELEFRVNGVRVLQKNLPATNGVLHLIDGTFPVYQLMEEEQQTSSNQSFALKKIHHFTIWGGLGLLAAIVLVVLLSILGWRKRERLRLAYNRFRSSDGFKFQHLEEEGEDERPVSSVSFHSGLAFDDSSDDRIEGLPVSQK